MYSSKILSKDLLESYIENHQAVKKQAVKRQIIDDYFQKRHNNKSFDGVVLIAEHGNIIYENAFGYADRKNKIPFDVKTSAFQLASVTKPISSTAILMLQERGLLNINDNVQKYFPNFPYPDITLKLLLEHRSGLSEYMYFSDKLWLNTSIPINNQDVLELLEKNIPDIYFSPDRKYNYSNTNYCILGAIIEKVSGKSYADFVQKEIFETLGMKNSFVNQLKEIKQARESHSNAVSSYRWHGKKVIPTYQDGVAGDKGIYASAYDLLKFDNALYNNVLLTKNSKENMFMPPSNSNLYKHDNYALGWRINEMPDGEKITYHSGWWKGFRTYYVRIPEQKQTIIVLSNCTNGRFGIGKLYELLQQSSIKSGITKIGKTWRGLPLDSSNPNP